MMKISLEKKSAKSILILLLGMAVTGCIPSEEEEVTKFNQTYAPEYNITDKNLYVNWEGDPKTQAVPLKLKIPLPYLRGVMNTDGSIGVLQTALTPMDHDRKDPRKKKYIDSIAIQITMQGEPVIPDSTHLFSSKAEHQKRMEYDAQIYTFEIGGIPRMHLPVNDKQYYGGEIKDIFRAKDVNGLENYQPLSCYDVKELKEDVRLKRMGYEGARLSLELLANKEPSDLSPKNCIVNYRTQFWVSPQNTPAHEAVGIKCSTTANCVIIFLYKDYGVGIITHKNYLEVIPKWQVYKQQVTDVIKKLEM